MRICSNKKCETRYPDHHDKCPSCKDTVYKQLSVITKHKVIEPEVEVDPLTVVSGDYNYDYEPWNKD